MSSSTCKIDGGWLHESEEDQAPNSRQFTFSGFSIGPTQNTLRLDNVLLQSFDTVLVLGGFPECAAFGTPILALLVLLAASARVTRHFRKREWVRMSKNNKNTINKCKFIIMEAVRSANDDIRSVGNTMPNTAGSVADRVLSQRLGFFFRRRRNRLIKVDEPRKLCRDLFVFISHTLLIPTSRMQFIIAATNPNQTFPASSTDNQQPSP